MRIKTIVLLILPIFLSTLIAFNSVVYAVEERKVLSRNYVGLGVEVYAPYQCYSGEIITVKVRVEALEDVKNASVTVSFGVPSLKDAIRGAPLPQSSTSQIFQVEQLKKKHTT